MQIPDSPGTLRRRIRALLREETTLIGEVRILTAEDEEDRDAQRRVDADRRKLLSGMGVLYRVLERHGLIRWLRRALDRELTRSTDRDLFRLEDDGPLIPPEDWPGWPDARPVEAALPEAPRNRLPTGRRRARLVYLRKRHAVIRTQLDDLMKRYSPHLDVRNRQRMIVVGAVMLTLSFRNDRVAQWLRRLLDRRYAAVRDRRLFSLEGDGPLVPAEDQARLRPTTRRQAVTTPASDAPSPVAGGKAPRPASAAPGTSGSGDTGASGDSDAVRAHNPDRAGDDAVAPDVQDPIPGWQPHRLRGASPSRSGGRPRTSVWGASLTGHAAVAALPQELRGRRIRVVDSNLDDWTTMITEVVSRDEHRIIVRNAGRPRRDGAASRGSEGPDSSSS